jgi:hypothetical protein
MSENTRVILSLSIACALFGAAFGAILASAEIKKEAVKIGAACWIADSHGQPEFKWLVAESLVIPKSLK